MWPLIPIVIGLGALIGGIVSAVSNEKLKISSASDCSDEFLKFNQNLTITSTKVKLLIKTRKAIQQKLKNYFSNKTNTTTPGFYIQGSYKHETIIRKQNDTCDIDVGLYFFKKPEISPAAIHNNIFSVLENHTKEKPTVKNKCVRVYYSGQFHIDLPVYYVEGNKYYIGIGDNGWREDDPKLFTKWLKKNTKDNPQKIRLIKYFKAWADFAKQRLGQRMPSGLALTIWILEFFEEDKREDVAFLKTAIALRNHLKDSSFSKWKCIMPTIPGDNVIEKLNEDQRKNFFNALSKLIEDSSKIIESQTKEGCIESWKVIFGKWF